MSNCGTVWTEAAEILSIGMYCSAGKFVSLIKDFHKCSFWDRMNRCGRNIIDCNVLPHWRICIAHKRLPQISKSGTIWKDAAEVWLIIMYLRNGRFTSLVKDFHTCTNLGTCEQIWQTCTSGNGLSDLQNVSSGFSPYKGRWGWWKWPYVPGWWALCGIVRLLLLDRQSSASHELGRPIKKNKADHKSPAWNEMITVALRVWTL